MRRGGKLRGAFALDGLFFESRAESLDGERAPQVRRRRLPGAAALAVEQPDQHARNLVAPAGVVQHHEQKPRGVDVAVDHQPPEVIVRLAREHQPRALVREPRAQDILRGVDAFGAPQRAGHALE
ncbi:MAG: hypothetical protein P8Y76_15850, partial [bacterium]